MTRVFISYRRDDTADLTARVADRLAAQLGERNVFLGPIPIPPGANVRDTISQFLAGMDVVIVMVGRGFLQPAAGASWAPVYDPNDGMRMEMEAVLNLPARRPLLLPLLVHGATMPEARLLPPSLQSLPFTQALTVRPDPDFANDLARVLATIRQYAAGAPAVSSAPTNRVWGRYPWFRALSLVPCLCAFIALVTSVDASNQFHSINAVTITTFILTLIFVLAMPTMAIISWVLAIRLRRLRWLAVLIITFLGLILAFLFPYALGGAPALLGLSGMVTPFLFSLTLK